MGGGASRRKDNRRRTEHRSTEPWTCARCTFLNPARNRRCEMCQGPLTRPQWLCNPCNFVNSHSAKACAICQRSKEEATKTMPVKTHTAQIDVSRLQQITSTGFSRQMTIMLDWMAPPPSYDSVDFSAPTTTTGEHSGNYGNELDSLQEMKQTNKQLDLLSGGSSAPLILNGKTHAPLQSEKRVENKQRSDHEEKDEDDEEEDVPELILHAQDVWFYTDLMRLTTAHGGVSEDRMEMLVKMKNKMKITDYEHQQVLACIGYSPQEFEDLKDVDTRVTKKCVQCNTRPVMCVVLDCMHICMCTTCADLASTNSVCPECEGPLKDCRKVYF